MSSLQRPWAGLIRFTGLTSKHSIKYAEGPVEYLRMLTIILTIQCCAGSTEAADSSPQEAYDNERVITEADGSKTRLVRWAIGRRDHVATLRIPEVYASAVMSVGCHPFGKDAVDPNCAQPYSTGLSLDAMLPDFRPRPKRRLTGDEERWTITIMIDSVLTGLSEQNEADSMQIKASVEFEGLNSGPDRKGYPLIVKEPRFGLNRIGLDAVQSPRKAWFDDFYFSGQPFSSADLFTCPVYQPSVRMLPWASHDNGFRICRQFIEADDIFVCSVEDMPTRDVDPHFPGIPLCKHWFTVPEISAIVSVTYERQHLKDWQKIKQQTLDMISRFHK